MCKQSTCDFFSSSSTLLDLSNWPYFVCWYKSFTILGTRVAFFSLINVGSVFSFLLARAPAYIKYLIRPCCSRRLFNFSLVHVNDLISHLVQARGARAAAKRLASMGGGCVLAAFGVGRGVDEAELIHIIEPGACLIKAVLGTSFYGCDGCMFNLVLIIKVTIHQPGVAAQDPSNKMSLKELH